MARLLNNGVSTDTIGFSIYSAARPTTAITVCFWFKETASAGGVIASRWGSDQSWVLEQTTANKPQFYIRVSEVNKTSGATSNSYNTGVWNHCAGIFDGSNVKLKINAGLTEDITGDATAGPIDDPNDNIVLGNYNNGGNNWGGWIAEFAVFNRALSNGELQTAMRFGAYRVSGCVLYAPLWGASGAGDEPNLVSSASKTNGVLNGVCAIADHPPINPIWSGASWRSFKSGSQALTESFDAAMSTFAGDLSLTGGLVQNIDASMAAFAGDLSLHTVFSQSLTAGMAAFAGDLSTPSAQFVSLDQDMPLFNATLSITTGPPAPDHCEPVPVPSGSPQLFFSQEPDERAGS